jgi:hypothetical protein
MKLGLNVVIAGVLALALLVPAATAKPGNGNGNGPPAGAGGGSGGAKESGKPAWAGQGQTKKAEKAAQRAERRAAESDSDAPKHDNPAWVCKFEREQMGAEVFAETYGTNENKANAFGMCVSKEARDRDGVTGDDEEKPEPVVEEPSLEDEATGEDALAALKAFFQALRQLMVF